MNLREAAQAVIEQLKHGWVSESDYVAVNLKAALEQPEQEPVAILHRYPSKASLRVVYTDEITEVDEGSWPLYLHPPQRKPLTDEEIMGMVRDECAVMRWPSTALNIARAIERAHGIGDEA